MKSLSLAMSIRKAAKKKMSKGGEVEPVKQNFLSDEDEQSEMSDESSEMFNNPHDAEGDMPNLEDIMKKVRRKHLGK